MMFTPARVFFEQAAIDYPLGKKLLDHFQKVKIPVKIIGSHNRVTGIPSKTRQQAFDEAKRTLVVGVRKTLKFETCRPSAHYQLPLATSCPGMCEYCYLNTTLGKKPYIRVYVNLDEILEQAGKYIEERSPEITVFEGAATSDPLPVEPYTGSLKKTIEFFGKSKLGRFRFVSKFTEIDSLLNANHNNHTRIRFSINPEKVIKRFEHKTPGIAERLEAAEKVKNARYPLGFMIAPVITYEGWQKDYSDLLQKIHKTMDKKDDITFEIITHRYTARAKQNILEVFPNTKLPMIEEERKFKYGQFGYGKYIYPKEAMEEIKSFFEDRLNKYFPEAKLVYII